jgi:hypothetical protein
MDRHATVWHFVAASAQGRSKRRSSVARYGPDSECDDERLLIDAARNPVLTRVPRTLSR